MNEQSIPPKLPQMPRPEETAGFGVRLGARILDHLFCIVMIIPSTIIGVIITRGFDIGRFSGHSTSGAMILSFLLSSLGVFLYFLVCESKYGVTVGKKMLKLRVVSQDLSGPTFTGALIRNLFYIVDAVVFGLVAFLVMRFSQWNQRVGDILGKTVVLKEESVPFEQRDQGQSAKKAILWATLILVIFQTLGIIVKRL